MILRIEDDFDLKKIADSGQCFRFNECGDGSYSVSAFDKHMFVSELDDNRYEFGCSKEEFEEFWKNYFDLDLSYKDIRGRIHKDSDPYLYAASEFGKGIRILKQNPWEMLISFIISQRSDPVTGKAFRQILEGREFHDLFVHIAGAGAMDHDHRGYRF